MATRLRCTGGGGAPSASTTTLTASRCLTVAGTSNGLLPAAPERRVFSPAATSSATAVLTSRQWTRVRSAALPAEGTHPPTRTIGPTRLAPSRAALTAPVARGLAHEADTAPRRAGGTAGRARQPRARSRHGCDDANGSAPTGRSPRGEVQSGRPSTSSPIHTYLSRPAPPPPPWTGPTGGY